MRLINRRSILDSLWDILVHKYQVKPSARTQMYNSFEIFENIEEMIPNIMYGEIRDIK